MLLHADHNEDSFALRGQILDDMAALRNASIYVWYEQGANSRFRLPDNGSYHLWSPVPFKHAVRSASVVFSHGTSRTRCSARTCGYD
jgi:nitric oxide dioxygenase